MWWGGIINYFGYIQRIGRCLDAYKEMRTRISLKNYLLYLWIHVSDLLF